MARFKFDHGNGKKQELQRPWMPKNEAGAAESLLNMLICLVTMMRRRCDFKAAYLRIPTVQRPRPPLTPLFSRLLDMAELCETVGIGLGVGNETVTSTRNHISTHYGHLLKSSQSGGGSEPQPLKPVYAVLGACVPVNPERELAGSALAQHYFGMAFKVNTRCSACGTAACAYTQDMIEAEWLYPVCIPLLEDGKDLPTLIAEEMRDRTPAGMQLVNAMNQSIHDFHAAHKGNDCPTGSDLIDVDIDTSSPFLLIEVDVEDPDACNLGAVRAKGEGLKAFTYDGTQYELLAILYAHEHETKTGGTTAHIMMDATWDGKVVHYDDMLSKQHVRTQQDYHYKHVTDPNGKCNVVALMYVRKS